MLGAQLAVRRWSSVRVCKRAEGVLKGQNLGAVCDTEAARALSTSSRVNTRASAWSSSWHPAGQTHLWLDQGYAQQTLASMWPHIFQQTFSWPSLFLSEAQAR